ncbi:DUF6427 family protein [Capnocytophaga sp. ARDL2]|uniref:DUF6427 family protein n=1 Tax=Capnocytophaga sp. ARDL2 TaxID=3238809 RepID=UPI00355728D7
MLKELFSKSRPIGYVVISVGLLVAYSIFLFADSGWLQNPSEIVTKSLLFITMVATVLLVQFTSIKNQLNSNSLYSFFFYSCFILLFPSYLENSNIIMSNFFVLLGVNRLFAMFSLENIKQKIFDAGMFFVCASLFDPWAILYFLLIYFSILQYGSSDYRNWLIPFVSVGVSCVLIYSFFLIENGSFLSFFEDKFMTSFNFQYFENDYQRLALSIFASASCLFFINQVRILKDLPMHLTSHYKKLLFCFIIGVLVYIVQSPKVNASLSYTFFPLSIAAGNLVLYLQTKWMKEVVLWATLAIGTIFFLLNL